MRERLLGPGSVVVRQGGPGESLFVVAEGALDVTVNGDGVQVPLDRIVPGDVFGEISLPTDAPRSATVTAATDAVVFEIAQQDLEPIIQGGPSLPKPSRA